MPALSTLAGGSTALARLSLCKWCSFVSRTRTCSANGPGQLIVNRMKDVGHFYLIGLGLLPAVLITVISHIVYGGACELQDYPTDGSIPHYWQFERTPMRQFLMKYLGYSDIQRHESNLSYHERNNILSRWRRYEDRVKHLQGERWDYKGWYYEPVSASWVDIARHQAERYRNQYEEHGHYVK
ncbi:Complex I-SGDH [Aphelenchoides fujianensis]|nr:Complex I-SGDH [Aphelenchoides fujianensis]